MTRWFDLNGEMEMEGERGRSDGGLIRPSAWLSAGDRAGSRNRRRWPWFLDSLPLGYAPAPTDVPQVEPPHEEDDDMEYMVRPSRPSGGRGSCPPVKTFTIATWNSRGNPAASPAKHKVLLSLIKDCSVILLQECGKLKQSDLPRNRHLYASEHAGAYNNRCRSAIISNVPLRNIDGGTLPSSNGRAYSYGIYENALMVGTLHANASNDAGMDRRAAAEAMLKLTKNHNLIGFVLGGDFNVDPGGRTITVGGSWRGKDAKIAYCRPPTHIHGGKLDYFIYFSQDSGAVECLNTRRGRRLGGSDHYPVITDVHYVSRTPQLRAPVRSPAPRASASP
ncbi:endonuclease/exonuclease/phosphatase family protein [Sorangium sp. So ce1000]|uniref:endonuclease/exonuclease/phosphatase family protein n=1 Tax=Sorangium sp. So ce1000 TaxID=3133325 RepID=UPI003F5F8FEA